jgi:ABC-type multidrug transport system ATPase subunit
MLRRRHEVWRRIDRMAAQGAGVIVSSHDLAEAERCSRAALLSEGRVVAAGTPDEIARDAPQQRFCCSALTLARFKNRLTEQQTRCVFFRGQCGSLVLSEMMPVAVFALIASGFALLGYRRRID